MFKKKLKLVRQGNDNNCGQCCLATILGISLEKAIEDVGKKGLTNYRHLIKVFKKYNINCDNGCTLGGDHLDPAILKFSTSNRKKSHWVIYFNKRYYDPANGISKRIPKYLQNSDIISHLNFKLDI